MDIVIRRMRQLYQIEAISKAGLNWMREHYGDTGSTWADRLHFVHHDYIEDIIKGMKEDGLSVDY